MIYRVLLDGQDIYDTTKELSLISPSVNVAMNGGGSVEFTMPTCHTFYEQPRYMLSDIEVYEKNDLIWFGRILDISLDMKLNKKINGEGAFAFFNDSIQRHNTITNSHVHDIFETLINIHNSQVPANRQFDIGDVNVDNDEAGAETNYETTKTLLENLRSSVGGYYFFRKKNGRNIIDWLSDLPETSTQPVQFGLNLVDLSQIYSGADLFTSIIPLGKEIDGEKVNVSSVNDGNDYIDTDLIDTFGRITKVVEFSEIEAPTDLKLAAEKWLSNQHVGRVKIKCDAADLNYLNGEYTPLRIGKYVHVTSTPHRIDQILPLLEINISIDSAVKKVSIGTPDDDKLSKL